ncbi:kinase superfamily protein [Arabidopsis thaliana]|uniref:Kinase superfamily protein n=1 Tax=Arabidopsis thaliana TaxID=3702 RepID=A0A1I9LNR7_ARATH|nr:kinase superfamily protein [Arabidopsis thaliana]NP_567145.2 kinase superfamily protein [Arabidopsis thaliana]AEE80468.1 kinase superfamily protein [Arabidopsis thaliana]ANM64225.1 kinase superfamily protein [Arabidopsis thaliana]|eukprot:NP_001326270.1 kinase superfamily protein [Arabidopsis thaliana]
MTSSIKSSLLNLGLLIIFFVFFFLVINCRGESSTCLAVYKQGGAPAVFQSPKCPRWILQNWGSPTHSGAGRCHTAAIQGRRNYQEDRLLCALDLRIPFPGKTGTPKDVLVGIAAVFDGHNGAEASDMASKLLLDYFALHINFLLDATFSAMTRKLIGRFPTKGDHSVILHGVSRDEIMHLYNLDFQMQFRDSLPLHFDDSLPLDIMKEALLRAIHDIDVTFTKEASNRKLNSGSTATIALIADGQLMVASIGDSKALLCSEKFETLEEARATLVKLYRERRRNRGSSPSRFSDFKLEHGNGLLRFIAKELTKDHHPNREDEKIRVEAAGGYVTEWAGVPRVNGQLTVSRAIGDLTYRSYGVISAPEVMDWQPLVANDSFLVVSSDGIFEKLEVQEVCDLLWEVNNQTSSGAGVPSYCSISLADCLVNTAFEKGSMDNMAAVVVPLKSNLVTQLQRKEQSMNDNKDKIASALPCSNCTLPLPNDINLGPLQLKQAQPLGTMFNRLLVEVKNGSFCRFYMSENLIGASQGQMNNLNGYMGDLPQVLPASAEQFPGWCLPSGTATNENQDQCINPDSFATFLGLLESVPLHGFGAKNGTDEIPFPDSSYVLKKKFGRGAFGEVWLAFHWDCYQGNNATSSINEDENTSKNGVHNDTDGPNNSFILKRIMVERGPTVYLSGLREKHFGELFLNAYNVSESSSATQASSSQAASSELGLSEEGLKHIARYIEYFESRYNDIWLVFHHEGVSLSKLMYTVEEAEISSEKAEEASHGQILRPSKWWTWLKTTESGKEEMRRIIWQLLLGLKACHDRNITHRDIKPENMVICLEDIKSGRCLKGVPNGDQNFKTNMRIIDFGSALDEYTIKHLYGSTGPSRAEQTHDYAPPEAILNSSWHHGPTSLTLKYDMWSVGVVMLEMILGSPNVFEISSVTRALLDQHIRGWSENFKELAYKLRSLMEMCILIPGSSLKHGGASSKQGGISLASWKCSEEFFAEQIKSRDPLKIGFPNVWALRLVRGLLQWYPEDRVTVDEALQHPYFQPPPSS